jgi:hypothetical protein
MPSSCNYLFNVPLSESTSFLLTTRFSLAGHLQVCSFGKATAVRCNAVFLLQRPQVSYLGCVLSTILFVAVLCVLAKLRWPHKMKANGLLGWPFF